MRDRLTSGEVSAGIGDNEILNWLTEEGCIPRGQAAGPIRFQAVFFIGPAASGKSFVKEKKYLKHLQFHDVDPDEIKKTHPDFDPDRPSAQIHFWSKKKSNKMYEDIITGDTGDSVIVDGTGRNWTSVDRKVKLAERYGYRTFLVYVYVPFEISIFRNRNRSRFVPEEVIMEQSSKIADSYKRLKSKVDKSKVVIAYDRSQLAEAKKDLEVYPPPQPARPPRPGDPDYGRPVAASSRRKAEVGVPTRVLRLVVNAFEDIEDGVESCDFLKAKKAAELLVEVVESNSEDAEAMGFDSKAIRVLKDAPKIFWKASYRAEDATDHMLKMEKVVSGLGIGRR